MDSDVSIAPKAALPEPLRGLSTKHRAMVAVAAKSLGSDPEDFTIHRIVMRHQPIPTTLVVRFGLAEAPRV